MTQASAHNPRRIDEVIQSTTWLASLGTQDQWRNEKGALKTESPEELGTSASWRGMDPFEPQSNKSLSLFPLYTEKSPSHRQA